MKVMLFQSQFIISKIYIYIFTPEAKILKVLKIDQRVRGGI
jgi:hypothetical protein